MESEEQPEAAEPVMSATRIDKDAILMALDSLAGTVMSMRMLLDKLMPDGMVLVEGDGEPGCPHENRAPSDSAFCLDCETEVGGVSAGFTGGESA